MPFSDTVGTIRFLTLLSTSSAYAMLLSMTGHGEALVQDDTASVQVEVRTVNNRFLKLNVSTDLDAAIQSQVEGIVKQNVGRGSVSVRIKSRPVGEAEPYQLNESLLRSYWLQLSEIAGSSQSVNLESLLSLPGVVEEASSADQQEKLWPIVQTAVEQAMENLNEMRAREGNAMKQDMLSNCQLITQQLESIRKQAPAVIENYAKKMSDRINNLLEKYDVSIQPTDLVREVGVFAERCDFSEETVRLDSHIDQFNEIIQRPESNGRKLDFLVQEMLRETNTIGSKANDATIATHVVEIKTAIERIREMVQNVE
jgi:uncharacterized protein (TIGR00255 family)